jgi:glycosyltransferase involved in cell wall biosynthesis
LTIAGASPSARLTVLAEGTTGVTLTGYLEELDSVFSSHDIFLAPLFTGAGVKFKNIHAMLAGEPVITTSIGAEGIGDHSLFAAVVDTLDEFTTEAIELANNPIKRFEVARRAQRWAREQYGEELFRTRLLDVYVGTGCGE